MSLHAKYLAMLQEVAKAMPDASERKHRAVAERLLKFPIYYILDESGNIKTLGSSTIVDEVETLLRLEPDLLDATEAQPAKTESPAAEATVCGLPKAEFDKLSPARQVELKIGAGAEAPAVASWQKKQAGPVSRDEICRHTGLSESAFAALPLERRLELENETRFARGAK